LPGEAKRGGPWVSTAVGEIVKLRPEIRLELARVGFARLIGKPPDYRVEAQNEKPRRYRWGRCGIVLPLDKSSDQM
jgi:hypothetical protein